MEVSRSTSVMSYVQHLASTGISYTTALSRRLVLGSLSNTWSGSLLIEMPDGEHAVFGQDLSSGVQPVTIKVHNEFFWTRVLLFGDIGFAQSYMLQEISCPDLTAVFEFFIHNSAAISATSTNGIFSYTIGPVLQRIGRKANDVATARLNAAAHYSLSNDMFAAFLSPDMTYSAPLWLPASDPLYATDTLEEAQLRKLQYAISATQIKSTDRVLEIGTGWGSFAILAAKTTGCRVTTVTPSEEQKKLAEERFKAAGLSDRIEVVQADYRQVRLKDGRRFDKIVSIEMIEHVGHAFLDTYFECVDRYLKRDGGIGYLQSITIPETRYSAYLRGEDFIKKYIFPGGHLPTVSGLVASINKGSKGRLIVEEIKSMGAHYPRALRCWNEKFHENFEEKIVPALLKSHHDMTKAEICVFKRKWEVSSLEISISNIMLTNVTVLLLLLCGRIQHQVIRRCRDYHKARIIQKIRKT